MRKLVLAAALSVLSVLALAAPASATPAPLSDAEMDRMIAAAAAELPAPGTPEWAARKTAPQTLALRPGSGPARNAAAAVICTAFSQVLRSTGGGFFIAVGEATSSCPAPVDYLSAKATLFFFVPDLNRWEIASYGSLGVAVPYRNPGEAVTSVASSNCRAAHFAVVGVHEARLGTARATASTESNYVLFTCG
ncbi:hypothetical protein [Catenuloplanes indicus]|uniref:Uncharacterized protein n=1 Tax=Catenuloplanes indicus TaxID=137267 RepID=A0AAE3W9M8_9ACTN|nr:hypothetical protein [Catenuloplanes indicus]MDQ0371219.1 hypothetical protein [Catenuloplanes indicus]